MQYAVSFDNNDYQQTIITCRFARKKNCICSKLIHFTLIHVFLRTHDTCQSIKNNDLSCKSFNIPINLQSKTIVI